MGRLGGRRAGHGPRHLAHLNAHATASAPATTSATSPERVGGGRGGGSGPFGSPRLDRFLCQRELRVVSCDTELAAASVHGEENIGKTRALVEAEGKDSKLLQWVDIDGNDISRYGTHRRGGGSSRTVFSFIPPPRPLFVGEG